MLCSGIMKVQHGCKTCIHKNVCHSCLMCFVFLSFSFLCYFEAVVSNMFIANDQNFIKQQQQQKSEMTGTISSKCNLVPRTFPFFKVDLRSGRSPGIQVDVRNAVLVQN